MSFPSPNSWKEYPLYIIGYWLVFWAILFFISVAFNMDDITPDGLYMRRIDCLYSTRYDPNDDYECLEYSEPYEIPAGELIKFRFEKSGWITGIPTIVFGLIIMFTEIIEKRKSRK